MLKDITGTVFDIKGMILNKLHFTSMDRLFLIGLHGNFTLNKLNPILSNIVDVCTALPPS